MISLTNHDFQWGRSEVVIIYPDHIMLPSQRGKKLSQLHKELPQSPQLSIRQGGVQPRRAEKWRFIAGKKTWENHGNIRKSMEIS